MCFSKQLIRRKNPFWLLLLITIKLSETVVFDYGFSCSKLAHKRMSQTYRFTDVFPDKSVFLRKYVKTVMTIALFLFF